MTYQALDDEANRTFHEEGEGRRSSLLLNVSRPKGNVEEFTLTTSVEVVQDKTGNIVITQTEEVT